MNDLIQHGKNQLKLYEPCGCGSGKKFKFCCKPLEAITTATKPNKPTFEYVSVDTPNTEVHVYRAGANDDNQGN
jgi:hypothetical protein